MIEIPIPRGFARRLEQLCTAFEEAWKAGQGPQIEDCLREEEACRATLFRELLGLELDYRRAHGERPQAQEYRRRFQAFTDVIDSLFAEGSPADEPENAEALAITSDPTTARAPS